MASGHEFMLVVVRLANACYRHEITPVQVAEVIAHEFGGEPLRLPKPKELMREMAEIPGFAEYCSLLAKKYAG